MPGSRSKRKRTEAASVPQRQSSSASPTPGARRTGAEPNSGGSKNSKNEESSNTSTGKTRDASPLEATTNKAKSSEPKSTSSTSRNFPLRAQTPPKKPPTVSTEAATTGPTVSSEEGNNEQAEGTPVSHGSSTGGAAPLHTEGENSKAAVEEDTSKTSAAATATATVAEPNLSEEKAPLASGGSAMTAESSMGLDEEQQARIRLFLSHRKLLLERVVQGRAVAQRRLSYLVEENPSKKDETEEEEAAAYLALTREVTSMARKQTRMDAEAGAGGEKRVSVSLRRGSSVGKRMNAALSSLAPGTATASAAAAAAAAKSGEVQQSGTMAVKSSAMAGTRAPASSAAAGTTTIPPSLLSGAQPMPSAASLPLAPPVKKSVSAAPARPMSQKAPRPPSVTRNIPQIPPATGHHHHQQHHRHLPMHHTQQHSTPATGSMMYTTNILGAPIRLPQQQPAIVVPQAAALRDRKKLLQQRLKLILTKQQQRIQQETDQNPTVVATPSPPKTNAEKIAAASVAAASRTTATTAITPRPVSQMMQTMSVKGCARPTKLPPRRRTHWDYLLEEMRWTATDFIEERKWKVAAAKIVAHEALAPEPSASAASPAGQRDDDQKKQGETKPVDPPAEKTATKLENGTNDEPVPMDCDRSVEDDKVPPKESLDRPYPQPSNEDAEHAQRAARTTSELVSDFAACVDGMKLRSNAAMGCPKQRTKSEEMVDAPKLSNVSSKEEAYKLISDRIDCLSKQKAPGGSATKSKSSRKDFGIDLSERQRAAVDFVERMWNSHDSGAIMGGPLGSGKTLAACALLWRHRRTGPHLVLCSPLSTFKWMTEIRCFDGLHVLPGHSAWSESDSELGRDNVVVCEYDALSEFSDVSLRSFGTVIVDCRVPMGYRGSRPASILERVDHARTAPRALSTPAWWSNLSSSVLVSEAKTLLVCVSSPNDTDGHLEGLPERQLLECLALRMAFLLGTPDFQAPAWSIEKTILGWSRKRIKETEYAGTKFQKVRKLLVDLVDPFFYQIKDPKNPPFSWELRKSVMPAEQRSAYDSCCLDVRGALTKDPTSSCASDEQFSPMADALLRLRRLCVHAHLEEILADPMVLARTGSLFRSKRKDSPSQPCHEAAARILSGSGKLRDLIDIMVNDAAVDLGREVRDVVSGKGRRNSGGGKARRPTQKVAILAVLPEVQILASVLLNALGIGHELLLSSSVFPVHQDASLAAEEGSLSWAECQVALSKFNDRSSPPVESVDVVIASPTTVAGDHGGIGVEAADHVVLLDDDWSGRSELMVQAVLIRCCSSSSSSARCVRLVAADTCEHNFVSCGKAESKRQARSRKDLPWPVDSFGSFSVPGSIHPSEAEKVAEVWSERQPGKNVFTFPGVNFFSFREDPLSEVLCCSEPLPRLFGSASELLFLPFESEEDGIQCEIGLIRSLVEKESAAGTRSCDTLTSTADGLKTTFPPAPSDVVPGLTSQEELRLLSMRHRFRSFAKVFDGEGTIVQDSVPELPAEVNSAPYGEGSDLADSIEDDVEVVPRKAAQSLLCYTERLNSVDPLQAQRRSRSRSNMFSVAFSCSRDMGSGGDGSQGSEPLVYFPPVFPRLLESSVIAETSVESLRSQLPDAKRPAADEPSDTPDAKRPRLEKELMATAVSSPHRIVTEDEATRSDAASVLIDLADDYGLAGIGAVPLPRDSALSAGHASIGTTSYGRDSALQSTFVVGASPCDAEEAGAMRRVGNENGSSMILFVSRKRPRGYSGLPLTQRSQQGMPGMTMPWASLTPSAASISIGAGGSGLLHDMNGAGPGGKKLKKKNVQREESITASAFNRLPNFDPSQAAQAAALAGGPPMAKMRDLYRSRVLAACRQSGGGTTLFEAPAFRAAVVRLRNKIGDRLGRHCWQSSNAYEVGPGLPLGVKYQAPTSEYGMFEVNQTLWTSIVKRLKNASASTGDEAIEISIAQRAALRRSTVSPCRVDFGPFQVGFMSSPSGMTAIAFPRPRPGVSLPMGVKVPLAAKDQSLPWAVKEDEELQRCAVRFGTNWTLAARVLSGYEDVVIVSRQASGTRHVPRAAKSCREHWQSLARSNPVLSNEVRQSERRQREQATLKLDQTQEEVVSYRRAALPAFSSSNEANEAATPAGKTVEFLLMTSTDEKEPSEREAKMADNAKDEPPPTTTAMADSDVAVDPTKKRRSFSAMAAAKAKRKTAPMTIPGMTSGNQPAVSPSHKSHLESVQSSIAATWTGGRTDMWPLQLLDAADRHRAATAPPPAAGTAPPANSSRQSSVSRGPATNGASRPPTNSSAVGTAASSQQRRAPPPSTSTAPRPSSHGRAHHPQPPPGGSSRAGQNRTTRSFVPPPQQQQQQQHPAAAPPRTARSQPQARPHPPHPSQNGPHQQHPQQPPIRK